jgi:hypothetical protein
MLRVTNGHIAEYDEPEIFADDDTIDYTEDSFDKFLSNEESDLIK